VIKLEYKGPYEGEYWEIPTYGEIVRVRNGKCEVKYEDTAQTLEMHGFVRVSSNGNNTPAQKVEVSIDSPPVLPPETGKERKVVEMYKNGNASVSMISKTLRISKKKVEKILETYKDYIDSGEKNV